MCSSYTNGGALHRLSPRKNRFNGSSLDYFYAHFLSLLDVRRSFANVYTSYNNERALKLKECAHADETPFVDERDYRLQFVYFPA